MDKYTEWTFKRQDLTPGSQVFLALLLHFCDEDYKVNYKEFKQWVEKEGFCGCVGVDKWVRTNVANLEDKGYVITTRKGRRAYEIRDTMTILYEEVNLRDQAELKYRNELESIIKERERAYNSANEAYATKLKKWEEENAKRYETRHRGRIKGFRGEYNKAYRERKRLESVSDHEAGEAGPVQHPA